MSIGQQLLSAVKKKFRSSQKETLASQEVRNSKQSLPKPQAKGSLPIARTKQVQSFHDPADAKLRMGRGREKQPLNSGSRRNSRSHSPGQNKEMQESFYDQFFNYEE